jgi:hypothetical protein
MNLMIDIKKFKKVRKNMWKNVKKEKMEKDFVTK